MWEGLKLTSMGAGGIGIIECGNCLEPTNHVCTKLTLLWERQ